MEAWFGHHYRQKIEVKLLSVDGKMHIEKQFIGNAGFILEAPKLTDRAWNLPHFCIK